MNGAIATGHVMRCLAIADAAKEQGEDTTFLLADDQAAELLKERGYPFIILHTKWNDMDSELAVIAEVAAARKIRTLLIDSYQITKNYLKKLTAMVNTVYLDDRNIFVYPVNTIICYASYWKKYKYEEQYTDTKLLLGPAYTPLRADFRNCRRKKIRAEVEELLLLSGGADHYDILERILEKIDKERYRRIEVICGMYYSKYGELCEKYKKYDNVHIHAAVTDMETYMDRADLAVTAGGLTLYELCAFGTPAISYSIADNQLENVRKFQADGIIDYAGDVRWDDITAHICGYLKKYHTDKRLRQERSEKMQALVDGRGAERIAKYLIEIT